MFKRTKRLFGKTAAMPAIAGLAAALLLGACASGGEAKKGFENALQSVVKIDVWEESQSDGGAERSMGSGVIVSEDGYIVTNAHVVNAYAEKIIVTLPCLERAKAYLVGWDHWTDIAVIKLDMREVEKKKLKFSRSKFGDSDKLKSGDTVYAIGTPHGFARTVTKGIISTPDRYFDGSLNERGYETGIFNTWLQTDAAINPGNSGGPLVLENGDVVGINTLVARDSNNLGFAVPANVAKKVAEEIKNKRVVERAYTGISLKPLLEMDDELHAEGALVQNVDVGSPAALAGISAGDIITDIDGRKIDGRYPEQLPAIMRYIAGKKPGENIKFGIKKNGKKLTKNVAAEKLESRIGRKTTLRDWGVDFRDITKALRREMKLSQNACAIVEKVKSASKFDLADIAAGDIIIAIDNKKIEKPDDLINAYEAARKKDRDILIQVMRNRAISYHIMKNKNTKK